MAIDHYRVEHDGQWWPLYVAPPDGWVHDREQPYPLLVILDADWKMGIVTEAVRWLANYAGLTPVVVAGIGFRERGDDAGVRRERATDYTPPALAGWPDTPEEYRSAEVGQADRLAGALTIEVLPAIRDRYQAGGPAVLFGHSIAGLFGLHMLARGGPFEGYAISSPSTWFGGGVALAAIDDLSGVPVVLSVGELEASYMRHSAAQTWKALHTAGAQLYSHTVPMEDHLGAEAVALSVAVRVLFDGPHRTTLQDRLRNQILTT